MPTGQTPAAAASVRRWLNMLLEGRQLSPAQRRVAAFLLDHPDEAVWLSAEELGRRSGVSQPTVSRFATALGFDGYPELREQARSQVQEQLRGSGADPDAVSALRRLVAAETTNLTELASSPWAGERVDRIGGFLAESRPLPVLGLRVSKPFADLFVHFAAKVHPDVRSVPEGSSVTTPWSAPASQVRRGFWSSACRVIPVRCWIRSTSPAASGCASHWSPTARCARWPTRSTICWPHRWPRP